MKLFAAVGLLSTFLGADVVVSPAGDDANPGTADAPVLTLERARALVRGGGTVWLRGGIYERRANLLLTEADSNTIWEAWPGEEPRVVGAQSALGFVPWEGHAPILRAMSIPDPGRLTTRGFGRANRPAALEVFHNGRPMTLARWPNRGFAYTSSAATGAFTVASNRLSSWAQEPDLWVHGYWTYDWADSYEKVAGLTPATGEIRTEPPHGVYGYAAGKRFEVVNALAELDEPGEYYVDRVKGTLYFWPPEPGETWVSVLEAPLMTIRNAVNVTLRGITFEMTRGNGVEISGGEGNRIVQCRLRNIGNLAVRVEGGKDHGVVGCEIHDTGDGGISLSGGDRRTLTPAGHFAEWNHLYRFSRWVRTYRPAIQLAGVGHRAFRNRIHHAPHEGIALSGNDHLIEGNDIHSVAFETADVGAFYFGRDWTWRGNVLRNNFFHNQGAGDVNSVYLDDCASGTLVENNLFERAGRSVFIGGGRDNVVRGNVFIDGNPGVEVDARGMTWATKWFDGTDSTLMDRLRAMPYQSPPWSDRYPALVNILEDEPAKPKGNVISGNQFRGGLALRLRDRTDQWVRVENNEENVAQPDLPRVWTPIDPPDEVVHFRMELVRAQNPVRVLLVMDNLGRIDAEGRFAVWTWPESPLRTAEFRLAPGEKHQQEFEVETTAAELWIGAQRDGDDLRPIALKVAVRR